MFVNNIVRATITHPITEPATLQLNDKAKHHFSPVAVTINYFNYLPFDVSIVERSGFRHSVPSVIGENATHCDFIVRLTYTIRSSSISDIKRVINSMDVRPDDEVSIIKMTFADNTGKYGNYSYIGFEVVLETRYKHELFSKINSDLYCNKRDIVISSKPTSDASAHPYHADSKYGGELLISDLESLNYEDYAVRVEIIDNFDETGSKYSYSLGDVACIVPKKDPTRLNGVYVTKIEKNTLIGSGFRIKTDKYEISEAQEKLKLYDSVKEAEAGGDLAASRKLELENLTYQHSLLKRDNDQSSLKYKRELDDIEHARKLETLQWEQRIKYLERENEQLTILRENERNDRKDFFERNSQYRKETIDYLKFLPHLIISIGAIYLAVNKLSAPNSK
jgi:hypothetical protein